MDTGNKSYGEHAPISSGAQSASSTTVVAPAVGASIRLRDGEITIAELIDRYMLAYTGRDPTRGQRLRWWIAQVGDLRIADLTDDDDRIFHSLDHLATCHGRYYAGVDADGRAIHKSKCKPVAPATVNRYAAALSAVFTWATRKRFTPARWQSPFRRIQRQPEQNEIVRFLSDKEREGLLFEARRSAWSKLYLLTLLALVTGARKGELLGLRWCDIDFDNATAGLVRSKNGDRRTLPLTAPAIEELRKHAGLPGSLVFASKRRPDTSYNFTTSWVRALKDAGVKHFRFHDLRHSAASYLAMSGASLVEIGDLLGHRSASVTRRYSHLSIGHKKALVSRVLGSIK